MKEIPGLWGFLLFLSEIPIFYINPRAGTAVALVIAAVINSYTDFKWRYVDDQFIYQPVMFAIALSYLNDGIREFTYVFIFMAAISFLLYFFGVWSSGDVTSTIAASSVFSLVTPSVNSLVQFAIVLALSVFIPFFIIGLRRCGKACLVTNFRQLTASSIAAPGYVAASALLGTINPLIPLAIFPFIFVSRTLYYALAVVGYVLLPWKPVLTPERAVIIASATWIGLYLYYVSKNVSKTFVKHVPAKSLNVGDVISEMVLEEPRIVLPATLTNIVRVKQSGAKVVVFPNAEGLSEEELEYIQTNFEKQVFTVKETVYVAPFLFIGAIAFLLLNIYF